MSTVSASPERLGGRYELQRVLGRGGMADVFAARDSVLGRQVAVKVLRDTSHRERFEAEARTLAGLSHPALVTVLDAGVSGDRAWLVMELVDGVSLADCCSGVGQPPDRVAAVGARLADALGYVHNSGFIHRDIKPANVLLARDDRVLLADFGIARLIEGAPTMTDTGFTIGTAAYLAPEQVRGETITPAADVYSLGLVLLEALTGERAYPGVAAEAAVARLTRSPTVPEWLPDGWRQLLTAMTTFEADARPTAAHVAERLRAFADGMNVAAAAATITLEARRTGTRPLTVPMSQQLDASTLPARTTKPARDGRSQRRFPVVRALTGHRLMWTVGAVVVLLVLIGALAVFGGGDGSSPSPVPTKNTGVPSNVQRDLQQLHQAVTGK